MAEWNTSPSWHSIDEINDGYSFQSYLDISASDFNKLVENMQYLYTHLGEGEFNMDKIYPIGSIYMTLDPTFKPAEVFGGVWTQLTDRFLVGAGGAYDVETKGGTTSHSHEAGDNMIANIDISTSYNSWVYRSVEVNENWTTTGKFTTTDGDVDSQARARGVALSGTTASTTNLPPYLAVCMWKRTA